MKNRINPPPLSKKPMRERAAMRSRWFGSPPPHVVGYRAISIECCHVIHTKFKFKIKPAPTTARQPDAQSAIYDWGTDPRLRRHWWVAGDICVGCDESAIAR